MRPFFTSLICLCLFILLSCEKITGPVGAVKNDFNKISFRQTSEDYFQINARKDLLLPSRVVKKIVYSQIEQNEVLFSEQIPFEYATADGQFQLDFSYKQRTRSKSDTISFLLSFESDNKVLYTIDTTFTLARIKDDDYEEFLRFETLGTNFAHYDLRANSIVFTRSSNLYEYYFSNGKLISLAAFENTAGFVASGSNFTFLSVDRQGLFRYNHNSDSVDLQIDLSQLEYDIGGSKFCYGMNVFQDSLFVIYYDHDLNNQMIARFDLNGRYFGSFMVDNTAMGQIWSLARYENLIFTFMDTGFTIWNRYTDKWDVLYVPDYGNRGGDCRIFQNWLYFIDSNDQFIYRIPMEKVVKVLFDTCPG